MINESVHSMRVALDAIRPVATFAHGLVDAADGYGELPAEVERQLSDFAEMTQKALTTIDGCAKANTADYDTGIVLTLALLALRALKDPEAVEGVDGGARGAFVNIAYAIHDRYRDLLEEISEASAEEIAQT